jgi:hypothetical protein
VRKAWPEARFLARARLAPRPVGAVSPPAGVAYETWGILIETADLDSAAEARAAVTDDGCAVRAIVPSPDDADPVAVLAAARYWELPPAYVRRLARVAAAPVEEYFY